MSSILVNISNSPTLVQISILADLFTSLGIIALAVLLHAVLGKQHKIISLVALGCWMVEAISLAISKIGSLALIPLSQEFVKAGTPGSSYYLTLGEFLYNSVVVQMGQTMELFFYCAGGILWYYLFYKSKYVPRVIPLYGILAVVLAMAGTVAEFLGYGASIIVFLPILPFELVIGVWLLLRGIKAEVPGVVEPPRAS